MCFLSHCRPPSEDQDNDTDEDRQDIVMPRYIGVNQGKIYLGPPKPAESTKDRVSGKIINLSLHYHFIHVQHTRTKSILRELSQRLEMLTESVYSCASCRDV